MNRTRLLPLAALAAVTVGIAAPATAQQVQTFANPTHEGFAVSYCDANGSVCGEQPATRWCVSQGFQYARDWAAARGDEVSEATVRLDDGSVCQGAQCEAFGSITCGGGGKTYRLPALGAAGRATLIAPNRRAAETEFQAVEFDVLIPGCHQREPGVFLCENVHDYQYCRSLLHEGRVSGCRAGLAFDGAFAEPVAAAPDAYDLELRSSSEITVEQGRRGQGRVKGEARFKVTFAPPSQRGMWCLQRDRYVYYPTGPKGGLSEIAGTADCDEPIEGSFAPHEDDVFQAYDLCEAFEAWGEELEQPSELLVAALFSVGSAHPAFASANASGTKIIAPYLTIAAPTKVKCKD